MGDKVNGVEIPLAENLLPFTPIAVIVMFALPLFVTERVFEAEEPAFTDPKSIALELGAKAPDPPPELGAEDGPAPTPQPRSRRQLTLITAIAILLVANQEYRPQACVPGGTFLACTSSDSADRLPK